MTIEGAAAGRHVQDLDDLRAQLERVEFPAHQDDILASLVAARCPARLLWHAGRLCRERVYLSAAEVCSELAQLPAAPLR